MVRARRSARDPGRPLAPGDLDRRAAPGLERPAGATCRSSGPAPSLARSSTATGAATARRCACGPGLTCLAAVEGRNTLRRSQMIDADQRYASRVTLASDLGILLRTVQRRPPAPRLPRRGRERGVRRGRGRRRRRWRADGLARREPATSGPGRPRATATPTSTPATCDAAAVLDDATPAAFAHGGVLHAFLVRPAARRRVRPHDAVRLRRAAGQPEAHGASRSGRPVRERRVVSEFVRFHPLRANHEGAGDVDLRHVQDTVTVDVQQDDDGLMAQMASAGRDGVRKAAKAGVEPRPRPRPGPVPRHVPRDDAAGRGGRALPLPRRSSSTRLERMGDGVVMLDAGCAAGLFLAGGGAMHYFLSASTDEGRALSATNAVLFAAMRHAREAGLATLHLGGGLADGDSLQRFKQSMGAGRAPFFVGSAIHDAGRLRGAVRGGRRSPTATASPPTAEAADSRAPDHVRHLAAALLPHVQAGEVPELDASSCAPRTPPPGRAAARRRRARRSRAGEAPPTRLPRTRACWGRVIPVRHLPTERVPIPA